MIELLNVLYVVTQGASLHLEHETVRIDVDGETRISVPVLRLSGIVVFGRVFLSPFLIQRFADDGRSIVWLDRRGRFKARLQGQTRGNVLLRRAQHLALSDPTTPARIARQMVAGKIQNSRSVLLRGAREAIAADDQYVLAAAADRLAAILIRLRGTTDLDRVRGAEGEAARAYFGAFGRLIRVDRDQFGFEVRSRRPPRDRTNALLSFLYVFLRAECSAALEGVGLDPQVGYLHALRPGRPALALDLMEELRAVVADRLALSLINRHQVRPTDFEDLPGGAVQLNEAGRRAVIEAFQRRKEDVIRHRVLKQKLPVGLLPHVQARLLARYLRGDLVEYMPYVHH